MANTRLFLIVLPLLGAQVSVASVPRSRALRADVRLKNAQFSRWIVRGVDRTAPVPAAAIECERAAGDAYWREERRAGGNSSFYRLAGKPGTAQAFYDAMRVDRPDLVQVESEDGWTTRMIQHNVDRGRLETNSLMCSAPSAEGRESGLEAFCILINGGTESF
jgi:hypothetical protein